MWPARRHEKPFPSLLLMPNGRKFPNAECRMMRHGKWKIVKVRLVRCLLCIDSFPKLVVIAPAVDDQKVKLLTTSVKDDKAKVTQAIEFAVGSLSPQEISRKIANPGRHALVGSGEVMPF